jgi:hypothetical protein
MLGIFILLILFELYLFHLSKNKFISLILLGFVFFTFAEAIYVGDFKLVKESYVYDSVLTSNIKEINYYYDFIPYQNLNVLADGFLWFGFIIVVIAFIDELYYLFLGNHFI